jgi:hypothetical protein
MTSGIEMTKLKSEAHTWVNRQEIGKHPYFWWQWVVSGPVIYPEDLKQKQLWKISDKGYL